MEFESEHTHPTLQSINSALSLLKENIETVEVTLAAIEEAEVLQDWIEESLNPVLDEIEDALAAAIDKPDTVDDVVDGLKAEGGMFSDLISSLQEVEDESDDIESSQERRKVKNAVATLRQAMSHLHTALIGAV